MTDTTTLSPGLSVSDPARSSTKKKAVLYRMVMPDHLCPFGLKSKYLLEQQGYEVEDHWLKTREETDAFLEEYDVKTSPQTWIDGKRVGGHDDLRVYFGKDDAEDDGKSYRPVLTLFAVAALLALAVTAFTAIPFGLRTFELFISISMTLLALQKLQDVESFSTMFLNYDLLARRWVPYGYIYPYGEALAGILMTAGILWWVSAPIAIIIGTIGAVSVFKAVYIDQRELKCACMGGDSNTPLGFISLTETVMMKAMGIWLLIKHLLL